MDSTVAVQVFACGDLMCGRVVGLVAPRDEKRGAVYLFDHASGADALRHSI